MTVNNDLRPRLDAPNQYALSIGSYIKMKTHRKQIPIVYSKGCAARHGVIAPVIAVMVSVPQPDLITLNAAAPMVATSLGQRRIR